MRLHSWRYVASGQRATPSGVAFFVCRGLSIIYVKKYTLICQGVLVFAIKLEDRGGAPHLDRLVFDDKVKMSWACNDVAAVISTSKIPEIGKDIVIEAWHEPRDLDYSKTNLRLRQAYNQLGELHEKVRRLKVKLDNY